MQFRSSSLAIAAVIATALKLLVIVPTIVFIGAHASAAAYQPKKKVTIPKELAAQFLATSLQIKDQMLKDYQTTLEVYYELKTKSVNPQTFSNYIYNPELAATLPEDMSAQFTAKTVSFVPEFDYDMYKEFQKQLDSDPRLRGNTYLADTRNYGSGRANDIFQHITAMSFDALEKKSTAVLDAEIKSALTSQIGIKVKDLGLLQSQGVFNKTSANAHYGQNHHEVNTEYLTHWQDAIDEKIKELAPELKKIGFTEMADKSGAGVCPAAFSKLAK